MDQKVRLRLLSGSLVVLAIVAVLVLRGYFNPSKPPPSEKGYYTGAMRSKGNPEIFATEDGKVVPPPAGATTPNASAATNAAVQGANESGRLATD